MAKIAGCAVRYARQCMCPATKYELPNEGCIGGMPWDYSCLAVDWVWLGNLLTCHSSEQLLAGMPRVDDKSYCELYSNACVCVCVCVCDSMQEEVT